MPDQDATKAAAWFDQFKPNPKFGHPQWCFRHWAPAPDLGANGIAASLALMQAAVARLGSEGKLGTAESVNRTLGDLGPLCCWLGDEIMYGIWGRCPPSSTPGSQLN